MPGELVILWAKGDPCTLLSSTGHGDTPSGHPSLCMLLLSGSLLCSPAPGMVTPQLIPTSPCLAPSFLPPPGSPLPSQTSRQHLLLLPAWPPPFPPEFSWFPLVFHSPGMARAVLLAGKSGNQTGGEIIQMSSWLELLKATSLLLSLPPPPPQKGDILQKRAKRCLGWSQQGEEHLEMAVGGQEGFPSFPECRKVSLSLEEGRHRAPLLGHFVLGGESQQGQAFGEGGKGLVWPGWASSSSPGAVPGSRRTSPSLTPMLLAAIYICSYISPYNKGIFPSKQHWDVEGCQDSKGRQFPAILSLPPCPKALPFFLQTPKIGYQRTREAFRGNQSRVHDRSALLLSSILTPFLSWPPLCPWPISPLLAPAFLPPSFLLHSCLLLSYFFTILPVSISLPPFQILPSPTTLSTLLLPSPPSSTN